MRKTIVLSDVHDVCYGFICLCNFMEKSMWKFEAI